MTDLRRERAGEFLAAGHTLFYASLPLFIVLSKDAFPPLFFTGMSFVLAGAFLLPVALVLEKGRFLPTKKVIMPMIVGAGIIVLIYNPLLTLAGQHTSPGNIAILTQTEVFFNFLFFGLLGLERVTTKRVWGSVLIVVGAVFILMQKFSGTLGGWDLMIVFLGALCPWANHLQKIALTAIGPLSLTVLRNLFGGTALLVLAVIFEPVSWDILRGQNFSLILLNSVLAFGLAKWLLFGAYQKIGVSKTIAINASLPAFTLFFSFLFLREIPTANQLLGLAAVTAGVLFVIEKPSQTRKNADITSKI